MNESDRLGRVLSVGVTAGLLASGAWGLCHGAGDMEGLLVKSVAFTLGQTDSYDEPRENFSLLVGTPVSRGETEPLTVSPEDAPEADKSVQSEGEKQKVSMEIPSEKPSAEVIAAIPYPADLSRQDGPVVKEKFGPYTGSQFVTLAGGGQVMNRTSVPNDTLLAESTKPVDLSVDIREGEPLVLIYHTHTTESFEPSDRSFYDSRYSSKTTDPSRNMTAIGDRICEELDRAGIPYIHDTLVHDHPSYNAAYDSSRATVQALLKKYPSVKIALDIHRDGLQRQDGTRVSPVATINGREAAQIMIISGCDDGTMGMPDYMKNYHFACALQSKLESSYAGLTRPILFDYRHYNQDLTAGSLLIEVGSHGNCFDQALYSAELIGKGLAELIKELDPGR